jgi:lauroyl/myristoyl acyltransferase
MSGPPVETANAAVSDPEDESAKRFAWLDWRRFRRIVYRAPCMHRALPWPLARFLVGLQARNRWRNPAVRAEAELQMAYLLGKSSRADEVTRLTRRYVREYCRLGERRWRPWLTTHMRLEGVETMRALVDGERGVLLSIAHLGDFYSVFPSLNHAGIIGIHAATAPLHFTGDSESYQRQGFATMVSAGGTIPFNALGSFGFICDELRKGGIVSIACDVAGSVPVTFLGRRVKVAAGTARAAVASGVLIVPITMHKERRRDGRFLRVEDPIDPAKFSSADQLMQAVVNAHEAAILAYPEGLQLPMERSHPADPADAARFSLA